MSFLLSLLALSPTIGAEPTYLRCAFDRAEIFITADEANSAVTVALPTTGYTEKMPAAFTASEVRFQNRSLAYVVSRTDLSVVRTIKMINSTDTGQCKIEQAPKRAF